MYSTSPSTEALRAGLDRDGFVTVPNALSETNLNSLRDCCHRSAELARAGQWPYFRTLPKQFPPWTNDASQGIWGVQHLLHPDMNNGDEYAASYFNDTVVDSVCALLQCKREDLVMELYNLLVRPDRNFALRWHRDDVPPELPAEEELARLREPMLHSQWNLALYDDTSLIVVPGSHNRARTDAERSADPYEDDMPGQKVVKMRAGDLVFYNNNVLHRGVYDSKVERMTLHGSMGVVGADSARARNILQHGIGDWAVKRDFTGLPDGKAQLAEAMKERLIAMGSGKDLGFFSASE